MLLSDFIIKKRGSSNKKPSKAILQMVGRYVKAANPDEVEYAEQQGESTSDLAIGERTWLNYGDYKAEWKEMVNYAKSAGFAANKAGLYGSRALLSASGLSKLTDAELEDYWESLNPSMRNTDAWKLAVTERNVREYRLPNGPAYAAFKAKPRSGSRGSRALAKIGVRVKDGVMTYTGAHGQQLVLRKPGLPNLDAMSDSELMSLWHATSIGGFTVARFLFPSRPKDYVRTTRSIGGWASNKATAMKCRASGDTHGEEIYGNIAASIYRDLPAYARWK